ncbi:MAG: hypothetical protein APR54_10360 [Candidatus Cloacimonas sp. SDB]|nr:MAG: hypothetical protein APR54_10360 [Candidatus Cloacimonas sp. SDB]
MTIKKELWVSTKDVAEFEGITPRAVGKRADNGIYQSKLDKSHGGRGKKLIKLSGKDVLKYQQYLNSKEPKELIPQGKILDYSISRFNLDKEIPQKYLRIGQLKAQVCNKILEMFDNDEFTKKEIYEIVAHQIRSSPYYSELRNLTNKSSFSDRSLQRMVKNYTESGKDYMALVPNYPVNSKKEIDISNDELNQLIKLLMSPNRVKIGPAIKHIKHLALKGQINSPSSPSTLRRAANRLEKKYKNEFYLARNGEEAFKNTKVKSIKRDWDTCKVGDILIADGHTMDFFIKDPITGKPKRMTLIAFMDAASRYICGASIAPNENTDNISSAFRMALINLGTAPKAVCIDNGKAFGGKYFVSKDLKKELGGLYDRLGCKVIFAEPYNAKAKIVERFFRTFHDDVSRKMIGFTGTDIKDKPKIDKPYEKWLGKKFKGDIVNLEEATTIINYYCTEFYANTPHTSLKGKTPAQVFIENKPPRTITEKALDDLMLAIESRAVTRQGIQLFGKLYWSSELMGYINEKITVRYDMSDMKTIKVFTGNNKFICTAPERVTQSHILVSDEQKNSLKNERAGISQIVERTKESVESLLSKHNCLNHNNPSKLIQGERHVLGSKTNTPPWEKPGISYKDKYKLFISNSTSQFTQKEAADILSINKETIKKLTQEFEDVLLKCISIRDNQKVYIKLNAPIKKKKDSQLELLF